MSKAIELSLNESGYILEALKQGIRLDGRELLEPREPEIILSKTEYGYAEIKWGKTLLAVRVSAEIIKPYEDRPFEGLFNISTEISSMASINFENGKNSDDEVLISRLIEKAIKRSNSLDLESLCLIAGEKVWNIRVDLNFLNYDGNIIDSGCFAVMVGLLHFKKPDISINGEDIIVHDIDERQPVPLSILHIPICISYSFFNPDNKEANLKGDLNNEISIIDSNGKEESVRDGSLVVTVNKNRELLQLSKNGGLPIDALTLMDLSRKAYSIAERWTDKIRQTIKRDEEERYEKLNLRLLEVGASR
ncbi:uncharacterized protein PRCAT00005465001 [Priceomyces carsonii]|uniref:uncharacterized protein n=1 Tax=Priceomyces carsonii TaxID=28549 RepID=UPI002EDAFC21|nr:unnamed protein product [Priceomyces carsonii]